VHAGDRAVEGGHGGEQHRPGLARRIVVGAIEAARMKAQRGEIVQRSDGPPAQISLGERAPDGLRHGEQTSGRFGQAHGRRRQMPERLKPRQAQEAARLAEHVVQAVEPAHPRDQVEQVAMLAGGGVGPFAGRALAAVGAAQPDIETAAGRVVGVADQPVAAFALAAGEIVAAHRLCLAREAARELGGALGHGLPPGKKGPPSGA
jgi:hypothetical protein